MTTGTRKLRYRADSAFRSSVLASNRRSRERDMDPDRRQRMNRLAADICRLRESIDWHLKMAEYQERRLLGLTREREAWKSGETPRKFGTGVSRPRKGDHSI